MRATTPTRAGARVGLALLAVLASAPALAGPPPGTAIVNVAQGTATEPLSSATLTAQSNAVVAIVGAVATPTLAFYADGSYSSVIRATALDDPLYVESLAPGCDLNPAGRDSVTISLRSSRTGDAESFLAVETGATTGRFRIEPRVSVRRGTAGFAGSVPGTLELAPNDAVTASLAGCGATLTEATVWVDPAGTVFDAVGNSAVAGVRVMLVDATGAGNGGDPGGPARVFQLDGVTPAPATIVTGADGRYLFPYVGPGTYRLVLVPPVDHRFPSTAAPGALPPGHVIDAAGSFGADFPVPSGGAPVQLDVPLDPLASAALFVEKSASRAFAELGDEVDYTVRVANRSDSALAAVTLEDRLPIGFAFVPGTARRDTARLADPFGTRGPRIALALGALARSEVATVRYRVRLGAAARDGDGINRAVAVGGGLRSNEASARVVVTSGAFAEEATLVGTVYLDRDRDRRQSAGEPGIPGVRLYLDDGTFVMTDAEGAYSVYGLPPRTMALKVDPVTLPPDARLESPVGARDDRAGVRIVDLQRGDLRRADFAAAPDSATQRAVEGRIARGGAFGDELGNGVKRPLAAAELGSGDLRSRPATGIAGDLGRLPLFEGEARHEGGTLGLGLAGLGAPAHPVAQWGPGGPPGRTRDAIDLERAVAPLDARLGFVGLADHDTLASDQATVRVKGPVGAALELSVNGVMVPETRVGRRVTFVERGLEAWEYVGVRLEPGANQVVLVARDAGVERERKEIQVVAPSRLARLAFVAPEHAAADGHSRVRIRMRALDANGVPVAARAFVTLEASTGAWEAADLDPATPGLQVAVEGGALDLSLLAPAVPGTAVLRAEAGGTRAEALVTFVPELRPLIVAGSIEGVLRLEDLKHGPAAGSVARHGFEQDIGQFASASSDGHASAAARAAMFVKGRVGEDMLLTLGYDSDRPAGLRRFRDIPPDAYEPVYGDASVRGYDAQTTGRLYARLDRRGASLLYGDFVTSGPGGARSLSAYSRSLTGLQHRFEDRRMRVDAFTSRERTKRRVDELPGLGLSGPYLLTSVPIVENSEQVEIVVRDRNQPAVVLSVAPRSRFTDYELEPLTGRLLFKSPVPSLDPDLNPVFVRVRYEVEGGGEAAWVSGVEVRGRVGARTEIGGSYVDDHDASDPYELRALFAAARLGTSTTLEGELAASHRPGAGRGEGGRLELRHESATIQARLHGAATSADFTNPTSGFAAGREEAGAHLSARLAARTRLLLDGLFSAETAGGSRRAGVLVGIDQGLTPSVRGELGMRLTCERRLPDTDLSSVLSARAKLAAQWPSHPELSGYGEVEQDVRESQRRMLAVGGEYRVFSRGRLYARHELISSLRGPYALDRSERRLSTVFGLDANVARDAHVFSEYRAADVLAAREAEAAVGLRNGWRLGDGFRASTSFERVSTLHGGAGPTLAITGAIETTDDPRLKASSRIEVRTATTGSSLLATSGLACRLDSAWTALGRNLMSISSDESRGALQRDRFQVGVAYRPAAGAWMALGRYELHLDREPQAGAAVRHRVANVLSARGTGELRGGMTASLGWAGKVASERAGLLHSTTQAQWLHGRWSRGFGAGWDAGLNTSVLVVDHLRSRRDGLGVELGRTLSNGLWVSAGWNRFGYADQDLPDEAYTRAGVYLKLRGRFDEDLFAQPRRRP